MDCIKLLKSLVIMIMVVIDTETKMIRLKSLYASSYIDKIIETFVNKHDRRSHLFCVCMAEATGKFGPVFTGPIFQVGVNGISHGPVFSGYGFMCCWLGSFMCVQSLWLCS